MDQIIAENNNETIDYNAKIGGYNIYGIIRPGITLHIENKIFNDTFSRRRIATNSGIHKGTTFHRHIFHRFSCDVFECKCLSKFGNKTYPSRLKDTSLIKKWLGQASLFLLNNALKPVACELIVYHNNYKSPVYFNHATEIDMIARRVTDNELFNISWKTGGTKKSYTCEEQFVKIENKNQSLKLYNNKSERAQIQQFIENKMLESNGIHIRNNFIVVLGNKSSESSPMILRKCEWRQNQRMREHVWNYIVRKFNS